MNEKRFGLPFVLCAPSGTGKSTLLERLRKEFPLFFSVSCTTRAPRPGEVNGRDYHFISREEFLQRRDQGYFAEWAQVHGNLYGTPLEEVRRNLKEGRDVLFDIDVQGAAQLAVSLPESVLVFMFPPSLGELRRRLEGRGTESPERLELRLGAARGEISQARWFQHWIVNQDLDQAYGQLRAVYVTATLRPSLQPHLPTSILEGYIHG